MFNQLTNTLISPRSISEILVYLLRDQLLNQLQLSRILGRFSMLIKGGAMRSSHRLCVETLLLLMLFVSPASAGTVWTDWTSMTLGGRGDSGDGCGIQCLPLGSATGTLNGVTVTYSGEVINKTVVNGTFLGWDPSTSFVGGTVTASPSTVGDIIGLSGIYTQPYGGTGSITFASPIVDPLFAIWSEGDANTLVSFTFNLTPTFEVGGPNALYGGSAISVSGNTVSGYEGNGVVQFTGTYSGLSWSNPAAEYWYGFTIGTNVSAIPEPTSLLLLGTGLGVIGLGAWRKRK
jgi:hypothetical protein